MLIEIYMLTRKFNGRWLADRAGLVNLIKQNSQSECEVVPGAWVALVFQR